MYRKITTKLRGLLFITLFFAAACETDTDSSPNGGPGDKIFRNAGKDMPLQEIIAGTFVLSNFEASLVASRIAQEMQSYPYTIFPPWDFAYEKLPYWKKITRNRAWYGHLRDLTLGHMHQGNLPKEELKDNMTVTMLNGDVANVSNENDRVRVDGILVIASTPAKDGYAYLLDGVREPRWANRSIMDIVDSDERFSILAQILSHPSMSAKREELASTTAELSLFAPTDAALAGLNLDRRQEPECSDALNRLIDNHIVDAVFPTMFTATRTFDTQSGSSLDWKFDTKTITCTRADNTTQEAGLDGDEEALASNGIVHPVGELLCTTIEPCRSSDPGYQCDIVCADGKVLADYCGSPTTTADEDACERKRDLCCVDDTTQCPTICDEYKVFNDDVYLYWDDMTCGEYMDSLTPTDPACTNPLPHVPDECCSNSFPSSPPAAANPCYDLCGDDRQMVGSRVLDEHMMTCFDYAQTTSADSAQCTSPDPSIVETCCDTPRPLPKPAGNFCCLCDGCYGTQSDRYYHKIGPDGLTCVAMDYQITTEHKYGDAECSAKQEAFSATCCDANFDPPPEVPGDYEGSGQPNPCNVPDPPGYCADTFPRCELCLDGSFPTKPYTTWAIAGVPGNPNCADLYWTGLYGGLPPAYCYPIRNAAQESCGCE